MLHYLPHYILSFHSILPTIPLVHPILLSPSPSLHLLQHQQLYTIFPVYQQYHCTLGDLQSEDEDTHRPHISRQSGCFTTDELRSWGSERRGVVGRWAGAHLMVTMVIQIVIHYLDNQNAVLVDVVCPLTKDQFYDWNPAVWVFNSEDVFRLKKENRLTPPTLWTLPPLSPHSTPSSYSNA